MNSVAVKIDKIEQSGGTFTDALADKGKSVLRSPVEIIIFIILEIGDIAVLVADRLYVAFSTVIYKVCE